MKKEGDAWLNGGRFTVRVTGGKAVLRNGNELLVSPAFANGAANQNVAFVKSAFRTALENQNIYDENTSIYHENMSFAFI